VSVTAIETAGTSLGVWKYYGQPPLKDLGVAPMMAPVPIVCGALIYLLGTQLRGRQRLLIAIVPIFALPAVYAAAGMPLYVALHADTSKLVQYVAGAATLGFCALVVAAGTLIAARWRQLLAGQEDGTEDRADRLGHVGDRSRGIGGDGDARQRDDGSGQRGRELLGGDRLA
jgi:hypothetical protein